jgi:3-deoxy-D-manno-octulosonic acid kinase
MTLPAAYTLLRAGAVRVAVRHDLAPTLGAWLLAPVLVVPPDARPVDGGRGAAWRLRLGGGPGIVLRCNRRGGVMARIAHDTYLRVRGHRPLQELAVTAEARRRGVPAAEVLAVRVEGSILYRGAVVTAEVAEAATLVEALRAAPDAGARRRLAEGAGRAVARMHGAGLRHADLNMTNLLARAGGDEMVVLDLDRARLSRPPLGRWARRRTLRRLARSWRKLDPAGALAGPDDVGAFRRAYAEQLGVACAC